MEEEEFNYSKFWNEQEKKEEVKIQKEIKNLPKGAPRKGVKGRYLKPKKYVSRRNSLKTMKSFVYSEKKVD